MPIYVYEHIDPVDGACEARFDRIESVSAAALAVCPECERPVRRVPSTFSHPKDVLSTRNVKEKGFTRLRRRDKGVYEAD